MVNENEKKEMMTSVILQKHMDTNPDFAIVCTSKKGKISFDITNCDDIGHFLFCSKLLDKAVKDTFEKYLMMTSPATQPQSEQAK